MDEKIKKLRKLMESRGLQAYLIPSADPHQSEYVPEFWKRRQFITGFTGSAGDAIVTLKKAGLWTDSRYHLQAERELSGSEFTLFKLGLPEVPTWPEWLARELAPGEVVGLDPQLITHRDFARLEQDLEWRGIQVLAIDENLVDAVWEGRPAPPSGEIRIQEEKYAGEGVQSKLDHLRKKMAEEGTNAHVITLLDVIAWLLNIRGSDVEFNPVAIAYAIVTTEEAKLFINAGKLPDEVKSALAKDVVIHGYDEFRTYLHWLKEEKKRVWVDEGSASEWVVRQLGGGDSGKSNGAPILLKPSPLLLFKALKNETEIAGFRAAHIRDGVAMARFFCWLEKEVPEGKVSEVSAVARLEEFRRGQENFRGSSFRTISSYGSHGAIIHYSPTEETNVPLRQDGLYLIDSGGQYLDATTDITRTVCLGSPTQEQRERFTQVLKGLIALSTISFPQGTSGRQLDTVARLALWEEGLNYGHGTGHGVGAHLNVHEGPQAISHQRCIGVALEPGMVTSIEPGSYKDGEYGIRLENLALVVKDEARSGEKAAFYTFETLTLCPIDLRLVKKELLTEKEAIWLNAYHERVRNSLTPHLEPEERRWLEEAACPI